MADVDGVNIKITADSSQAVREFKKLKDNAQQIANTKIKPIFSDWNTQSIGAGINKFFAKFDSVGKQLEASFGKIFKTITAVAFGKILAVGKVLKNALAIGGGFEAQMTSVKVISGATEEELEQLTKKAREMGATLPITAQNAAEAMTLLAQRGTKVKDILASVVDVSQLSISQGVDMGTAADLIGSTMSNFGIAIADVSKVTNMFNNASNQSALNISKLVEALKYVGPAAGSVGMELSEALSAMEALANSGLTGEMIGTGLAGVLSKLAIQSRVMGVETKTLDGAMRPLKEIFSELGERGFSLAEATEIFGTRGAKAALNLAKFSDSLAQNEQNLMQWGATQDAVNEKMKSWPNVWNAFQSATEELHIEIFEQIKEQSKEAVSSIATLTRSFSEWIHESDIANQTLNKFIEGLGIKIPSSSDFKRLLDEFDILAFLGKAKSFGATIKSIAESIVSFFNIIKTPLSFIIDHLETLATISFWNWIIGKGLQIPNAILNIANAFVDLHSALKGITLLNLGAFTSLLALFTGASVAGGVAVVANAAERITNRAEIVQEFRDKIQKEINNANNQAVFDIDINIKTGFEEIPASYDKASAEVRQSIKEDIFFLQEEFRDKIIDAVSAVNAKFPDMAKEFEGTANDISDILATRITKALQGSQNDFAALSDYWKQVIIQLSMVGVEAGQASGSIDDLITKYTLFQGKISGNNAKTDRVSDFTESLSRSINNALSDFPAELENLQKYLGGRDFDIALNISLDQARTQLENFSKSAAEKYGIPADIINTGIFNRLNELGSQGNKLAQSLSNGWQSAGANIDKFMQNARDAIEYLGVSPEKFTPAIEKITQGIQRIDPLTGKVTEQFKKAHNALKEWANVSFDKLSQRLQMLKKAYEGGFIDKNALETELRNISPQIKAKVVAELEPMRNQFRSNNDYFSVVASEYVSKIRDIFGDVGVNVIKQEFSNMWAKTGSAMGEIISRQSRLENSLTNQNTQVSLSNQDLTQAFAPVINKIEQISVQRQEVRDYSSIINEIKSVVTGIQEVKAAVNNLDATVKNLPQPQTQTIDLSSVTSAIIDVENAVRAITGGNNYDIDINQEGFIIQQKTDADALARSTVAALRSGIGNGGI